MKSGTPTPKAKKISQRNVKNRLKNAENDGIHSRRRLRMSTLKADASRLFPHVPVLSWTDDLPVCNLCGYGSSTNQVYRQDGFRREAHDFEDRSFHFEVDNCFLYGVFDGHDGTNAAHFAEQRMPADLLVGQLDGKITDKDVQEVLLQAFEAVEKGFFDSIDDMLAEKAKLRLELPEGVSMEDAWDQCPDLARKLQNLELATASGCTATLALIHENKLYVANCGNSRVLLCRRVEGRLKVQQLSYDHTIWDAGEQERLRDLGADLDTILKQGKIGNMVYTRCIGDYKVKVGHKDIEYLSQCVKDPVTSIPFVSQGIELDDSCQFLILMTDGLYTSLQDASDIVSANAEIAGMVAAEFQVQATLNGVAQAVVDRVVRIHHDTYMTTSSEERKEKCRIRDDLTLLIRNFNCKLAKVSSPVTSPTSLFPVRKGSAPCALNTLDNSSSMALYSTTDSTDSTDGLALSLNSMLQTLALDEQGKVGSYISFADYFQTIEKMTDEERKAYEEEVKLVPVCPPINEHEDEE